MRFRVPDAMRCAVPLRRAGTHPHRDGRSYTCFKPAAHVAGPRESGRAIVDGYGGSFTAPGFPAVENMLRRQNNREGCLASDSPQCAIISHLVVDLCNYCTSVALLCPQGGDGY